MSIISAAVVVLRALLMPRGVIIAENLCLRQELAVLHQPVRWPRVNSASGHVLPDEHGGANSLQSAKGHQPPILASPSRSAAEKPPAVETASSAWVKK